MLKVKATNYTILYTCKECLIKFDKMDVKVAMRPVMTIGKCLLSLKDPVEYRQISHLVNKISCAVCDYVYVEQTERD